ncbi:MAG: hypothetical protein Q4G11_06585 [Gallicola sp.]|nr:hypothetical protein [Gallicola sp.]
MNYTDAEIRALVEEIFAESLAEIMNRNTVPLQIISRDGQLKRVFPKQCKKELFLVTTVNTFFELRTDYFDELDDEDSLQMELDNYASLEVDAFLHIYDHGVSSDSLAFYDRHEMNLDYSSNELFLRIWNIVQDYAHEINM